jgi:hypothetical protein
MSSVPRDGLQPIAAIAADEEGLRDHRMGRSASKEALIAACKLSAAIRTITS